MAGKQGASTGPRALSCLFPKASVRKGRRRRVSTSSSSSFRANLGGSRLLVTGLSFRIKGPKAIYKGFLQQHVNISGLCFLVTFMLWLFVVEMEQVAVVRTRGAVTRGHEPSPRSPSLAWRWGLPPPREWQRLCLWNCSAGSVSGGCRDTFICLHVEFLQNAACQVVAMGALGTVSPRGPHLV